jgi:hypothetical protein
MKFNWKIILLYLLFGLIAFLAINNGLDRSTQVRCTGGDARACKALER